MGDPLDLARNIVRGPWVGDLPPELIPRKRRRDHKGPRKFVGVRLPVALADALEDLAGQCDMSVSELAGLILFAYLRRNGRA